MLYLALLLAPVTLDYADIHGSFGSSIPDNLTPAKSMAYRRCFWPSSADKGRTQTVSVYSSTEYPKLSVHPDYELLFGWPVSRSSPDTITVEVSIDESVFGPEGSSASIAYPNGTPKASTERGVVKPMARTGDRLAYQHVATKKFTIKVDQVYGNNSAVLPFDLGTISS